MDNYETFLRGKIVTAPVSGFDVDPSEIHPALKPHQRDGVRWALHGGRRALFESFGLGKTVQELEFCRQVLRHEGGKALIVLPLGVRQEFARDAVALEAVKAGRKGYTIELNNDYFRDAVGYLKAEDEKLETISLFDLIEGEGA